MTIIVGAIATVSFVAGIVVGRRGVSGGAWVAAGAQAFKHIARSIMEVIALVHDLHFSIAGIIRNSLSIVNK